MKNTSKDSENLLIKLLKHKDFDFSQIKPDLLFLIKQKPQLQTIITETMEAILSDAIQTKDLDNVKKVVEGNCLINREVINLSSIHDIKVDNITQSRLRY